MGVFITARRVAFSQISSIVFSFLVQLQTLEQLYLIEWFQLLTGLWLLKGYYAFDKVWYVGLLCKHQSSKVSGRVFGLYLFISH